MVVFFVEQWMGGRPVPLLTTCCSASLLIDSIINLEQNLRIKVLTQ